MEGFTAKVGIPPERAHESVFRFDGDKLNPNDTPEVRGHSSVGWGGLNILCGTMRVRKVVDMYAFPAAYGIV